MPTMPWTKWPLLLVLGLLLVLHLANADVSHLSKNYLPPDPKSSAAQPLADEPAPVEPGKANDGSYYPGGGLTLPSGYSVPTGSNVPQPHSAPPNFALPIYPPYFGFNGGGADAFGNGFANGAQGPQFQQPGQFPVGPQPGQFPVGPQPGQFPVGPQPGQFPLGPQPGQFPQGAQFVGGQQGPQFTPGQQGGGFPIGPQGGGFPVGQQGGGFPIGPQGGGFPVGPQGGAFQVGPTTFAPDYLTMQGLPAAAIQLPFQQNVGFGPQTGFGGPQSAHHFQHLVNVGQPFVPSFGIPGQNYQPHPQPFADEPQPEGKAKPKSTGAKALAKSQNKETIYASNGGYVYKRAK
ncbi:PREDICTED: glutenin, high molecular weight subunit PW212 [Drosophila arizonae]|uniref:Glutenin, high molecular weight subunit PW212 n=1 Tax=Drosophila arizonae TaxID=7263 RepID=A0ABM1PQM3_DROAR|nr:PREDICTED: glutenin, high molecular weight subunit PW212 [Drosophila arizonae]